MITNDYSKKWLAFIGIALLSFGSYLDYTIVNIALPTIQLQLQADLISLQWVMNIYFLTLCVLATIMGRLGDLYGRRRVFYIGAAIFAIASLIAGLATNIEGLIFGRFLQGVAGAIIFPLGPSLLPQSFPEKERGKSIAWLGSMGGIALALGPVLGGLMVTYLGWRWIFFINIPIVLLGYLTCRKVIKESFVENHKSQLDWKGMLLLAFAMCGIILSLLRIQTIGWNDQITLTYIFVGIISIFLLIKTERSQKDPLIDFKDFSNLIFFGGATLCFLAGALSAVALFFDPLYLQIIQNKTPAISGYILFSIPVALFTVAFLVEKLISSLGIVNTIILGIITACIAALLHVFFVHSTPLWYIIIACICLGTLWALGNTVPIIAAQMVADPSRLSVATGTMITMFNIGGSIGLTIAMVAYNYATSDKLNHLIQNNHLSQDQLTVLRNLIANPSDSLKSSVGEWMHNLFNGFFMHGFVGVMYFLVVLSSLAFLSVFTWVYISKRK